MLVVLAAAVAAAAAAAKGHLGKAEVGEAEVPVQVQQNVLGLCVRASRRRGYPHGRAGGGRMD